MEWIWLRIWPFSKTTYHWVLGAQDKPSIGLFITQMLKIKKTQSSSHPKGVAGVFRLVRSTLKSCLLPPNTPPSQPLELVLPQLVQPPHECQRRHSTVCTPSMCLQPRTLSYPPVIAHTPGHVVQCSVLVHTRPVTQH